MRVPSADAADDLHTVGLFEIQDDGRMLSHERSNPCRQHMSQSRRVRLQADFPPQPGPVSLRILVEPTKHIEQFINSVYQLEARTRWHDAVTAPLQQWLPEQLLERGNPSTDRRYDQVLPDGGFRQASRLHDRAEDL